MHGFFSNVHGSVTLIDDNYYWWTRQEFIISRDSHEWLYATNSKGLVPCIGNGISNLNHIHHPWLAWGQ